MLRLLLPLLLATALLLPARHAFAQGAFVATQATADSAEPAIDSAELDALIARLDERQLRELLDLRTLLITEIQDRVAAQEAAAAAGPSPALMRIEQHVRASVTAFSWILSTLVGNGISPPVWEQLAAPGVAPDLVRIAVTLSLCLGLGALAWLAIRSVLHRLRRRIITVRADAAMMLRLERILARTVLDGLAVLAFAAVALAAWLVFNGGASLDGATVDREQRLSLHYIYAAITVLIFDLGVRLTVAPEAPRLRLLPASDAYAAAIHRMVLVQSALGAFGFVTCGLVFELGPGDGTLIDSVAELHHVMVIGVGFLMFAGQLAWTWRNNHHARALFCQILPPDHPNADSPLARVPWINRVLAGVWAPALSVFLVGLFITWASWIALETPKAVTLAVVSLALVLLAPLVMRAVHLPLLRWAHKPMHDPVSRNPRAGELDPSRAFPEEADTEETPLTPQAAERSAAQRAAEQAQSQTTRRDQRRQRRIALAQVISQTLRASLLLVLSAVILALAGYSAGLWAPGSFGARVHDRVVSLLITGLVGWLAYGAMRACIDPFVVVYAGAADEDAAGRAQSRTETILPLLRLSLSILIIAILGMIVLSALGVDIAPLLAGAGIIGLAIGFGAQALVRDIISGIFFLVDDAFRVGEYIEFGDLRGEVEAITLRSLRIRHHKGAIHTIPFGEIASITNYSRDWVIYKFNLRLPYDTDIEKVRKLIKKVGAKLMEHPEHGPNLIQPLKSQGIVDMDDSALVMRVKFMCKPRRQFMIRREAYLRIMTALQEAGISLATRAVAVTVETVDEARQRDAELTRAAAGAAVESLQPASGPSLAKASGDHR